MSRVCIIGNSHLGAFKLALDGEDIPGVTERFEFDTFGSIRASLSQTKIEGDRLVPQRKNVTENFRRTSGGQTDVHLSSYSAFILAVRNSPYWIRPYLYDTNLGPVSEAAISAIHHAFLDDWSIDLARHIAQAAPNAQVFFLGRPLNSEKDFLARRLNSQLDGPDNVAASVAKDTLLLRMARIIKQSPLPDNMRLIRPPDHMLAANRLFTLAKYSRGAEKADTGLKQVFKEDDTQHMNGAYGAGMLAHLLKDL